MGTFINNIKKFDKILILLFVAAVTIGLVFIYSATKSMNGNIKFIIVQSIGVFIGIILMYIITCIDYEDLASLWKFFTGLSLFLLFLVLIIGIGAESTGTKGWIRFGSIGIQPAEIVKICFILTLAKHLDTIKDDINYIKNIFLLLCHLAIPLALILAQPDFGSAMVFVFIFVVMVFVANIDWRYLITAGIFSAIIAIVSWFFFLESYQKQRIYALFNPESADSCKEMKIKDWDSALYEFDELSYLCWTDTPEASYVLEYNPDAIPDEEILKMAESAEVPEKQ